MVRVGKAGINDSGRVYGHIVRHQEAVYRYHILALVVRRIGVAAAGYRVLRIQRRHQCNVFVTEQHLRHGLGPGVVPGTDAEHLIGITQQVLVKVPAAYTVIALFVLALHIAQQHFRLLIGDNAVRGVGGQMHGVEHQLLAVFHGHPADGVAAVQVHQLHDPRFNGQTPAQGGGDRCRGEGHQPRLRGPVGLGQRPKQERGVIVLPPHGAVPRESPAQDVRLISMVAAGGIGVHLLHEVKVRVLLFQKCGDVLEVRVQPLLGPGPRLGAAVHKEAVIRLIGPEAHIVGHHSVGSAGLDLSGGSPLCRQGQIIFDAVVVQKHIGYIA